MKKKILLFAVVFAFCFSFSALAGFDGGEARIAAMGGHTIALPDDSVQADLYSMGFSSAIFARPKKSFVSILPSFSAYLKQTVEDALDEETRKLDVFGGANAAGAPSYQGAVVWLSDESVLTVKPFLSGMFGENSRTYPGDDLVDPTYEDVSYYTLGGSAEFAQKLGDTIAVSLYLGYLRKGYSSNDKNELDKDNSYLEKLEYALSAVLLSDSKSGLNIAINVGNKTNLLADSPLSVKYTLLTEEEMEFSMIGGLFGLHSVSEYESGPNRIYSKTDWDSQGFTAEAGASLKGEGADILSGKAGVIVGLKTTEKYYRTSTVISTGVETVTDDETDVEIESGTGVIAEINARKDLGGIVAGLRGSVNDVFYKFEGSSYDRSILQYNAAAGICVGYGSDLVLPAEVFVNGYSLNRKNDTDDDTDMAYEIGLRAGGELALGKDLAVRAGVDYGALGYYSVDKENGEVTYQSAAIGSENNPYAMQLGINAGAGLKIGETEVNIGARVEPYWESPKDDGYKSRSDMRISVKADIKILI